MSIDSVTVTVADLSLPRSRILSYSHTYCNNCNDCNDYNDDNSNRNITCNIYNNINSDSTNND